MSGANSATKTKNATMTKPTIAPGLSRAGATRRPETAARALELDLSAFELGDRHQLSLIRGLMKA